MKKLVALSLAVLFAQACSEPTSPAANSGLAPRYGTKPNPSPPPSNPSVCPSGFSCQKFQGLDVSADADVGIAGSSVAKENAPAFGTDSTFAGRYAGTTAVSFTPATTGAINLKFNLYTIGTWEGDRKKGKSQEWDLTYSCGGGAETKIINATFANRLGNAQSYPYNIDARTHGGGMNTATGLDILGYKNTTGLTAFFHQYSTDVADTRYAIQRVIPACSAGTRVITMRGVNLTVNVGEASWAVDNISVEPAS